MNIKSSKFLYMLPAYVFILAAAALLFGGPSLRKSIPVKVKYSSYMPQANSILQITFEYPNTWNWEVYYENIQSEYGLIFTRNPDVGVENSPSSVNLISISVNSYESSDKTKTKMNTDISNFLQSQEVMQHQVLSDRVFVVDGFYARQITIRTKLLLSQKEPQLEEWVYILVENKYYIINLSTAESERNGKFGQGFDHMIETIDFVK